VDSTNVDIVTKKSNKNVLLKAAQLFKLW